MFPYYQCFPEVSLRLPVFLSERLGSLKSRKGLTSRLAADGETPAAIAATVAAALTAAAASEDVRVFIGAMGGEGKGRIQLARAGRR